MMVLMLFFVATPQLVSLKRSEVEHSKAMRKSDLDDGRVEAKMPSVLYAVIER